MRANPDSVPAQSDEQQDNSSLSATTSVEASSPPQADAACLATPRGAKPARLNIPEYFRSLTGNTGPFGRTAKCVLSLIVVLFFGFTFLGSSPINPEDPTFGTWVPPPIILDSPHDGRSMASSTATATSVPLPALQFTGNVTSLVPVSLNSVGYGTGLLRQSDCSMTAYYVGNYLTLSGNITMESLPDYQDYLHSAAQLTTTPDQFKNGCKQTMVGAASGYEVYAGQTSSGLAIYAVVDENNNFYYGTLDLSAGTQTVTQVTAIKAALSVVAADVNGDGNEDLIVADFGGTGDAGGVVVMLGNGDGTFAAPVFYSVGSTVGSLVVDDVNNDGKLDIVATSGANGNSLSVLPGNGDGTFGAAITAFSSTSATGIGTMATADINGDGNKDVVSENGKVFLGKGDGTFSAGTAITVPFTVNGQPLAGIPVLGDFNNDGKVDLALNDLGGGGVFIFLGNGDGTFTQGSSYASLYNSWSITATDIDGDGNLDLVVGSGNSGAIGPDVDHGIGLVEILMGNGDGTFQGAPMYPATASTAGTGTVSFTAGDFNGDGKPDVLAAKSGLMFMAGNGKGEFAAGVTTSGPNPTLVTSALMNADKNLDAVFIDYNQSSQTSQIGVAFGNGDGTFAATNDYPLPSSATSLITLITADVNGDGYPDVVATGLTSSGSALYVFLNDGTGALKAGQLVDTGTDEYQIVAADLNGDGKLDLVVADAGANSGEEGADVKVYLGNGDGTFQAPTTFQPNAQVLSIAVGDLNKDGIPDLVISDSGQFYQNFELTTMLGKGDGTFAAAVHTASPSGGGGMLAVADFNGDGNPDVAQGGCCGDSWLTVYLGNGDGTFSAQYGLAEAASINQIVAVDINGDGRPDILAGPEEGGGVGLEVFLNLYVTAATGAATTTTVTAAPNPASLGESVTLTATVAPASGTGTPTGTVTFYDGTTSLGTGTLSSGTATYSTSSLAVGTHSITASYGGDTSNEASTSSAVTVTVTVNALATTATALTASSTSAAAGTAITFTAAVKGASGSAAPTGTVTFYDGATSLGTGTLSAGSATYTTSSLAVGVHSITASYGGDANNRSSTSIAISVTITATPLVSTTTLTSSSASIAAGSSVTFTAVVAPPSGTTTVPTGTVTFLNGTTTLGTGTLNGSGAATYTTTSLPAGTDSITAQYGGDGVFATSTSTAVSVVVGTPNFSLSLSPSTVSIAGGGSGTTTVTATPTFGFASAITFACSGLPAHATCTFSPATVTPSGSAASTTTLTIATNTTSALLRKDLPTSRPNERTPLFCIVLLGAIGLLRARRQHRTLLRGARNLAVLAVLLLALAGGALIGCGGGSSNSTPAGTSTVTITATGGSQTQTTTLSVTVQ